MRCTRITREYATPHLEPALVRYRFRAGPAYDLLRSELHSSLCRRCRLQLKKAPLPHGVAFQDRWYLQTRVTS